MELINIGLGLWNLSKEEQLSSEIYSNCSGAETTSNRVINIGLEFIELRPKENNCLIRLIQIVLMLKLQAVSALQIIVSVSDVL